MKCFYHNDMDGRCAGAIVAQKEGNYNSDDFFEVDYVQKLPTESVGIGEKVYFVDYSFKENTKYVLDELLEKNCEIIFIDHHTSSINLLKEYPYLENIKGIRQDGISGAALTYMYLYDMDFDEIPYCVKLVSDYDCWLYKYEPNTTFFKIGIETRNFDALDSVWIDIFDDRNQEELIDIVSVGSTIKGYIDKDNLQYRNSYSYESEIAGYKCLVVNKKSNSWIFGEKYKEYPIVMIWVFDGKKYTYSIFSDDNNIDCSKIAESYSGGGHKGAAGFSSDELLFRSVQ